MASTLPPPPGFLLRIRRRWRYELPAAAFVGSGIGLMLGAGHRRPYLLMLAVFSFVLMCAWARCPRCRAPVVWRAISAARVWRWMTAVLDLRQCPACGFDGVSTDESRNRGATT